MSARVFVSASVSACVFLFRGAPNIRVLQRQELMQDSLLLIAGFICGLKTQTSPPTKALPTRCSAVACHAVLIFFALMSVHAHDMMQSRLLSH